MELITNLLSGGLIGSITSLVNQWFKHKEKQSDQEFELKKIKATSDAAIAEINARIEVEESITERAIAVEELKADVEESKGRNALIASVTGQINTDIMLKMISDDSWVGKAFRPFIYLHILFMDALRGTIRPLVTAGSIGFSCYVFIVAFEMYSKLETINPNDIMLYVIKPMIALLVFIVGVVVGFWFADKSSTRKFLSKA